LTSSLTRLLIFLTLRFHKLYFFSHVPGGYPYSIATCFDLLGEGDTCRPNNTPINITVIYPNDDSVNLNNVYRNLCDCAAGLTCIEGTCVRNVLKVQPR